MKFVFLRNMREITQKLKAIKSKGEAKELSLTQISALKTLMLVGAADLQSKLKALNAAQISVLKSVLGENTLHGDSLQSLIETRILQRKISRTDCFESSGVDLEFVVLMMCFNKELIVIDCDSAEAEALIESILKNGGATLKIKTLKAAHFYLLATNISKEILSSLKSNPSLKIDIFTAFNENAKKGGLSTRLIFDGADCGCYEKVNNGADSPREITQHELDFLLEISKAKQNKHAPQAPTQSAQTPTSSFSNLLNNTAQTAAERSAKAEESSGGAHKTAEGKYFENRPHAVFKAREIMREAKSGADCAWLLNSALAKQLKDFGKNDLRDFYEGDSRNSFLNAVFFYNGASGFFENAGELVEFVELVNSYLGAPLDSSELKSTILRPPHLENFVYGRDCELLAKHTAISPNAPLPPYFLARAVRNKKGREAEFYFVDLREFKGELYTRPRLVLISLHDVESCERFAQQDCYENLYKQHFGYIQKTPRSAPRFGLDLRKVPLVNIYKTPKNWREITRWEGNTLAINCDAFFINPLIYTRQNPNLSTAELWARVKETDTFWALKQPLYNHGFYEEAIINLLGLVQWYLKNQTPTNFMLIIKDAPGKCGKGAVLRTLIELLILGERDFKSETEGAEFDSETSIKFLEISAHELANSQFTSFALSAFLMISEDGKKMNAADENNFTNAIKRLVRTDGALGGVRAMYKESELALIRPFILRFTNNAAYFPPLHNAGDRIWLVESARIHEDSEWIARGISKETPKKDFFVFLDFVLFANFGELGFNPNALPPNRSRGREDKIDFIIKHTDLIKDFDTHATYLLEYLFDTNLKRVDIARCLSVLNNDEYERAHEIAKILLANHAMGREFGVAKNPRLKQFTAALKRFGLKGGDSFLAACFKLMRAKKSDDYLKLAYKEAEADCEGVDISEGKNNENEGFTEIEKQLLSGGGDFKGVCDEYK